MNLPDFLQHLPTVYCVRDKYQIVFITKETGAGAVIIDGKRYTDNMCGVVRSASNIHRVEVKADILNNAGGYTVEFKLIPERPSYGPQTVSTETAEFSFRPIPTDRDINCYILSDTHANITVPTEVAGYFGDKLDLLILGGDIGHNASKIERLVSIAELAANVAKGEIPVIYMRGNHETRGGFAEFLPDYVGTDRGLTYFPIRLGRLWFVVLDAGEDKPDNNEEYGDIADYAPMRQAQVEMLEDIIENSSKEYEAEGVDVRIALCHNPLRCNGACPEIFEKWTELLNEMGIHIMLAGHTHRLLFTAPEDAPSNITKHNFPCVECASLNRSDISLYKGTALTIGKDKMTVRFTDAQYNVVAEHIIPIDQH